MQLLLAHLSDNILGKDYSNSHSLEGACALKRQGTLGS